MVLQNSLSKIKREHLEKLALIYVRQSTLYGVQHNITGGRRQREDVEQLALKLGWLKENIKIVDEDQARSGRSTYKRYGYLDMLNAMSTGSVGAVFSLESTRVARDTADWHFLIKLCYVTGTLIIDAEGIYDPRDINDNFLMKIKSLGGEMEGHYVSDRMGGAKLKLAHEGTLRLQIPAGFEYSPDGTIELASDPAVQEAVRLAFRLFDKLGSARAVARYFHQNNLKFPAIVRPRLHALEHEWVRLAGNRMARLLQNPFYAGAYVYGRSKTERRAVIKPGGIPEIQTKTVKVPRDEWAVVIRDSHPAYISWSKYCRNIQQLARNYSPQARIRGSASRAGNALLQGICICGICGYRMTVAYHGKHYYFCAGESGKGGTSCQKIRGGQVDSNIEKLFLQALDPVRLEISLDALQRFEEQTLRQTDQFMARLKRSENVVLSLRERLLRVDYHNRYSFETVQNELKKREEELIRLKREQQNAQEAVGSQLSPAERKSIEALARDLPVVWSETKDMVVKKNLLRCLIEDVTLKKIEKRLEILVRWKTQASSKLEIRVLGRSDANSTNPEVMERMAQLSRTHTAKQIAAALNEEGLRTRTGRLFTPQRVWWICRWHGLSPQRIPAIEEGEYTPLALQQALGTRRSTIYRWCREGRLKAVRDKSRRLLVQITNDDVARINAEMKAIKRGFQVTDRRKKVVA